MAIRIAIFAALPQETTPILRLNRGWRPLANKPFPLNVCRSPGREILLAETGMGKKPAARAARQVVAMAGSQAPIDLMLSVGFAGALSPALVLGQVVSSSEVAVLDGSSGACPARYRCGRAANASLDQPDFFADRAVRPVRFVTVDALRSKAELARLVNETLAVVEMEAFWIAEVADAHDIPFIGLRAVSDEMSLEIDLDLDSVTDRNGRVRLSKLVPAVLARPHVARSLPALYRGSRLAGRNLARTLAALVALPEDELRALAGPPRPVEKW